MAPISANQRSTFSNPISGTSSFLPRHLSTGSLRSAYGVRKFGVLVSRKEALEAVEIYGGITQSNVHHGKISPERPIPPGTVTKCSRPNWRLAIADSEHSGAPAPELSVGLTNLTNLKILSTLRHCITAHGWVFGFCTIKLYSHPSSRPGRVTKHDKKRPMPQGTANCSSSPYYCVSYYCAFLSWKLFVTTPPYVEYVPGTL